MVVMVTATGEEHGLVNTLGNSVAFDDFKHMDPKTKAKVEKQKKEDARIVKAKYLNSRGRQERLDKPYCRYSGDPIRIYHLIPGYTYDLPVGFVNEINDKKEIRRSGLVSIDGESLKKDESPIDKDQLAAENLHQLVPTSF